MIDGVPVLVRVSVPDMVGVSVIVAEAVGDDESVVVVEGVADPVGVLDGLSPKDTVVVAVPEMDATIDLVVDPVLDAVGLEDGVNEAVAVTDAVPVGVGVLVADGDADKEGDNEIVDVWLADAPSVIEGDAEPLIEGDEEADGDAVLEAVGVGVPVSVVVGVGDGVMEPVGVGDVDCVCEGVVVCVCDGVFVAVIDADADVVNVAREEVDMDALEVPEFVLDDVDDADVVEVPVCDLSDVLVADEQAVDVDVRDDVGDRDEDVVTVFSAENVAYDAVAETLEDEDCVSVARADPVVELEEDTVAVTKELSEDDAVGVGVSGPACVTVVVAVDDTVTEVTADVVIVASLDCVAEADTVMVTSPVDELV